MSDAIIIVILITTISIFTIITIVNMIIISGIVINNNIISTVPISSIEYVFSICLIFLLFHFRNVRNGEVDFVGANWNNP